MLVSEEDILSVALWEWFIREPRMEDWTDEERLALSAGWWNTIATILEGSGRAVAQLLARGEALHRRARLGSWLAVLCYTERALEVERAEADLVDLVVRACVESEHPDAIDHRVERLRLARRELERAGRP